MDGRKLCKSDESEFGDVKFAQVEDRWGRIGFGVLEGWRPGMFIGVLHDGGDHKVELLDEKISPDACVILDMHCKQYPEYRNNYHYKELVKRLTEKWPSDGSAAWQAYHHLDTAESQSLASSPYPAKIGGYSS